MTCLGKAERKLLPVKTLRGSGKGFKETMLRGDKIKFLQPIQKGGDGESRSPTCDGRVGTTAVNVGCHSFFSPLFLQKIRVGASVRSAPDPSALAYAARVFSGGPSLPDPRSYRLTTAPQWGLLTVFQHPARGPGAQAQRRPGGPTDTGLVPSPRPPPHHRTDKRALKGSFAGGGRARGNGLCLFWLSVLINWRVTGQITFQSNHI